MLADHRPGRAAIRRAADKPKQQANDRQAAGRMIAIGDWWKVRQVCMNVSVAACPRLTSADLSSGPFADGPTQRSNAASGIGPLSGRLLRPATVTCSRRLRPGSRRTLRQPFRSVGAIASCSSAASAPRQRYSRGASAGGCHRGARQRHQCPARHGDRGHRCWHGRCDSCGGCHASPLGLQHEDASRNKHEAGPSRQRQGRWATFGPACSPRSSGGWRSSGWRSSAKQQRSVRPNAAPEIPHAGGSKGRSGVCSSAEGSRAACGVQPLWRQQQVKAALTPITAAAQNSVTLTTWARAPTPAPMLCANVAARAQFKGPSHAVQWQD